MYHPYNNYRVVNQGEVQSVWKPRHKCPPLLSVNKRKTTRQGTHPRQRLIKGHAELVTEPGSAALVPTLGVENLALGLRSKDDGPTHRPPINFFRTSSQGIALDGSARWSAKRRSNSAISSGVSSTAASRSASARLSHKASAKSTRSLAGSFSNSAICSGATSTSCHESCGPAICQSRRPNDLPLSRERRTRRSHYFDLPAARRLQRPVRRPKAVPGPRSQLLRCPNPTNPPVSATKRRPGRARL